MPSRLFQYLNGAALGTFIALTLTACQQDQPTSPSNGSGTDADEIIDFELTPAGAAAAKASVMVGTHGLPTIPLREQALSRINASAGRVDNSPFDLAYNGGPVVKAATYYVIYVNCVAPETPGTCWGNGTLASANFLRDLNASEYLRLANEYIGAEARLKFPVAASMRTTATFANPKRATLQEIQHIVSDAITAADGATGYAGMYHVFLPKGTEVCIVAGNCYSPSDPASWAFCAFHGSVNFSATQHVLFTVQLLLNVRQYFLQSQYSNTKHMCTSQAPV